MNPNEGGPSNVIECPCGARLLVPAHWGDRAVRCPKCQHEIDRVVAPVVLSSELATGGGPLCPICQSAIGPDEPVVKCPACDQVHHRPCWEEMGGCATYGCREAPASEKEAASPALSAWGDTKKCPICAEKIKAIALKCRYCGAKFDTVDPLTLVDVRRRMFRAEALHNAQKWVIAIFVASLFGCLAPLVLIVGLCTVPRKHAQLAKEGPLYLVLGYAAIALSAVYSLLMLGFALT